MPTFTTTTSTLFSEHNTVAWGNISKMQSTGKSKLEEGDFVKWITYNENNYKNTISPLFSIFSELTGKKLQIVKLYGTPYEHLCMVQLAGDPENKLYNVALCELYPYPKTQFSINKKLVAKINNISRDLRLIDGNFSEIMSSIVDKYLLKPLLKSEFEEIKATIKPIVSSLKKLEDDESDYILEELREIFLALSKDVVPDPQKKKKSEMEELRKKVLKDPF